MNKETLQSKKMDACERVARAIIHELNNILATMTYSAELAVYEIPESSPALEDVRRILMAGEEAGEFTEKIMGFCKPGKSGFTRFNLKEFLRDSLPPIQESLSGNIIFSAQLPDKDLFIKADPEQIRFIVSELIKNAATSIKNEKGLITLTLEEIASEKIDIPGSIRLSVADNGPGVPHGICEKIFDPFFTTGKPKAKGLGLAYVYSFIRNAGGDINLIKTANGSALFEIEIPISPKQETI